MTSATFQSHADPAETLARAEELGLSVVEYVRSLRRDAAWATALAAVAAEGAPPEPDVAGSGGALVD